MSASLPTIESLRKDAQTPLGKIKTLEDLNNYRVAWLGRSGKLTLLLKKLADVPLEKRKTLGKSYNDFKLELEEAVDAKEKTLLAAKRGEDLDKDALDPTLPGVPRPYGTMHPLSRVIEDLVGI